MYDFNSLMVPFHKELRECNKALKSTPYAYSYDDYYDVVKQFCTDQLSNFH